MRIPLAQVEGINKERTGKLRELWIYNVQQVFSLYKSSHWQGYLKETLGSDLDKILKFAEEKISNAEKIRLSEFPSRGDQPLGLKLLGSKKMMVGSPKISDLKKVRPLKEFSKSINWIWKMPQIHIRNQGDRGTCVAFAVTSVNEFLHYTNSRCDYLSPQFLYYECKDREGIDYEEGTTIGLAFSILKDVGEPKEVTCSYNPFIEAGTVKQNRPTKRAYEEAKYYKITERLELDSNSINDIKKALLKKRLVAIGIPVYDSWYVDSPYTKWSGEITLPKDKEKPTGGHAICIVGYQDVSNGDLTPPGGGFFIIRNSWGESWGITNSYASGYGLIPYAYIEKYGEQAFTARL